MAAQIVPPVRRAAVGFRLVFQGRFQFNPGRMAIVAKRGLVTHFANLIVPIRNLAMVLSKKGAVIKLLPVEILGTGLMAVDADWWTFADS
jgi:hypothetical protein